MTKELFGGRLIVKTGDITEEAVDALVNAANSTLLGGGGVDGAIHAAGGPEILEACKLIRQSQYLDGLPTGEAVITTGGNLIARHVIHTVGPIFGRNKGEDAVLLAACYRNSLTVAIENEFTSIAFPSISTGVYGYPKPEAAAISSRVVRESLETDPTLEQVRLVFFHDSDAEIFLKFAIL